jgi:hypothetical protein
MSELSKKYGIPESTIKALIKDGWLSCSLPKYEEVYYHYKAEYLKTGFKTKAVQNTSITTGYSESMVFYIVSKFE